MAEFPMTQQGYDEAVKKLEYLQKVKRAEIVQRIAEARSHGDLSENAEYDAARNEQAANERAIEELEYQVKNAVVIEESADNSVVHFGSVVTVHDVDFDEDIAYTIMGTTEADPMKNIISNESPVGVALIGHKKGETVTVKAPKETDVRIPVGDQTLYISRIQARYITHVSMDMIYDDDDIDSCPAFYTRSRYY